jgi:hypothetical protein
VLRRLGDSLSYDATMALIISRVNARGISWEASAVVGLSEEQSV